MIKTLKNLLKQDKERYSVPRKVQDVIPIQRIWKDGIFQVGNRFSKTYKFSDINYLVRKRCKPERNSGVVGSQRYFDHLKHLHALEFHIKGCVCQRNFRRISLRLMLNVPPMSLLK